jgi:hypothetical protein
VTASFWALTIIGLVWLVFIGWVTWYHNNRNLAVWRRVSEDKEDHK